MYPSPAVSDSDYWPLGLMHMCMSESESLCTCMTEVQSESESLCTCMTEVQIIGLWGLCTCVCQMSRSARVWQKFSQSQSRSARVWQKLFPTLRMFEVNQRTYEEFPWVLNWCRFSDHIYIYIYIYYITLIAISRERKEIIRFIPDIWESEIQQYLIYSIKALIEKRFLHKAFQRYF